MKKRLILFDFDGTLADTLPASFDAFRAVFKKYDGQDVTNEQLVAMFGPTEDDIIARNFNHQEFVHEAINEYYDLYGRGHSGRNDSNSILELLILLKENGLQVGIITGKSRRAFLISSEALKLSQYFDYVVTGDDVAKPKPDPEGIYEAMEYCGAQPEEVVFLGDSNADIRAGIAAGVQTYAVQWLPTYQSTAYEEKPDAIFKQPSEFIHLLKENGTLS
ncbi:HAD-IA family hydrolase [Paenibacillus sp. 5J-6]|uniref:HAD-IA family hydrolase n=1 Tax=Paenibacillus silvestris TaxID=2606219 RepID=A0A6L8UT98_9BACL|nr:HAD family hydrolase [Paenibacillus silvestris]MZQ81353.1 HAD-IA family hydrolase [Paenibacillus silvestris]